MCVTALLYMCVTIDIRLRRLLLTMIVMLLGAALCETNRKARAEWNEVRPSLRHTTNAECSSFVLFQLSLAFLLRNPWKRNA